MGWEGVRDFLRGSMVARLRSGDWGLGIRMNFWERHERRERRERDERYASGRGSTGRWSPEGGRLLRMLHYGGLIITSIKQHSPYILHHTPYTTH